jgi:hypothetical protein
MTPEREIFGFGYDHVGIGAEPDETTHAISFREKPTYGKNPGNAN